MKVGNYARTKDGKIFKWNNLCTTDKKDYEEHTRKILFIEDEIKSSLNIIDLIEVGDYVNGGQVREIEKDYIRISGGGYIWQFLKKEDIKSIVTKEQFENMEYKL